MKQTDTDRILILDFLRVAATFMVIFSHILFTLGRPWLQKYQVSFGMYPFVWSTWGEIGVSIFLILSGFSLEYTYGGKQTRFWHFYRKRIVRIYPVYYMSLMIGVAVFVAFAYAGNLRRGAVGSLLPDLGSLDYFLALTGFNAFFGRWGGPFVWSSWFIGVIMVLYLCYPALSWVSRKSPWFCIVLLVLITVTSRILIGQQTAFPRNTMQWFPLNRILEFGLGVVLARVVSRDSLKRLDGRLDNLPGLTFLSAISFPLFLVHDPLRRVMVIGPDTVLSRLLGITAFLAFSVMLSAVVLILDRKIQKKLAHSLEFSDTGRAC